MDSRRLLALSVALLSLAALVVACRREPRPLSSPAGPPPTPPGAESPDLASLAKAHPLTKESLERYIKDYPVFARACAKLDPKLTEAARTDPIAPDLAIIAQPAAQQALAAEMKGATNPQEFLATHLLVRSIGHVAAAHRDGISFKAELETTEKKAAAVRQQAQQTLSQPNVTAANRQKAQDDLSKAGAVLNLAKRWAKIEQQVQSLPDEQKKLVAEYEKRLTPLWAGG